MTDHLIFYSSANTRGKKDASHAFIPEATALREHLLRSYGSKYGSDLITVGIDCVNRSRIDRMETVLHYIANYKPKNVYFLGHGFKRSIQFGFRGQHHARILGYMLDALNVGTCVFYCCSTARNVGNFSQWVSEAAPLCHVFGHWGPGHTTRFPGVKLYKGGESEVVVSSKSELWQPWKKALQETDFRFGYTQLWDAEAIREAVRGM